jgi:uncharacterized protein (TIGR03086 family)
VAALTRGLELLESAVAYALASTAIVRPQLLSRPTPCTAWDLAMLLDHVSDSADVLHDAISAAPVGVRGAPDGSDPIRRLRGKLVALLAATASAGPADRSVAMWDRELAVTIVALTGAVEVTVHGWDIAEACGANRPVPAGLATVLLATAPLLVPTHARAGLFADPVRVLDPAGPGDELVAFLGRQPYRGDSGRSIWSA